jgi:hypothetical protein
MFDAEKEHDSTVMIRKRAARPTTDPASLYDKVVIRRRRKATDSDAVDSPVPPRPVTSDEIPH